MDNKFSKVKKELDFNTVVFRQLDRIMRSISNNDPNFELTIEALDCLLNCYEDGEYKTDRRSVLESLEKAKMELSKAKGVPANKLEDSDVNQIQFFVIKEKLKSLMRLALRNKLIPQKEETYYEED